jgi:hypothetical protein
MRYAEEMPRVRALWMLDAAQAALYPHLKREGARAWWDSLVRRTRRVVRAVGQLFTLNGAPVTPDALRERLGAELGGRFEER